MTAINYNFKILNETELKLSNDYLAYNKSTKTFFIISKSEKLPKDCTTYLSILSDEICKLIKYICSSTENRKTINPFIFLNNIRWIREKCLAHNRIADSKCVTFPHTWLCCINCCSSNVRYKTMGLSFIEHFKSATGLDCEINNVEQIKSLFITFTTHFHLLQQNPDIAAHLLGEGTSRHFYILQAQDGNFRWKFHWLKIASTLLRNDYINSDVNPLTHFPFVLKNSNFTHILLSISNDQTIHAQELISVVNCISKIFEAFIKQNYFRYEQLGRLAEITKEIVSFSPKYPLGNLFGNEKLVVKLFTKSMEIASHYSLFNMKFLDSPITSASYQKAIMDALSLKDVKNGSIIASTINEYAAPNFEKLFVNFVLSCFPRFEEQQKREICDGAETLASKGIESFVRSLTAPSIHRRNLIQFLASSDQSYPYLTDIIIDNCTKRCPEEEVEFLIILHKRRSNFGVVNL